LVALIVGVTYSCIVTRGKNCSYNLYAIDCSKQQLAVELGLTAVDTVTREQVARYLKAGTFPACPSC
jgi:hypothetical protein